jgi:hypothetical protein
MHILWDIMHDMEFYRDFVGLLLYVIRYKLSQRRLFLLDYGGTLVGNAFRSSL